MRRRWMNGLAAVLAMTLSACSEWGPHESVAAPSNDPALTASIRAPLLQTVGDPDQFGQMRLVCSGNGRFTGPLDIVMTAGLGVDLHQVELRLLDAQRILDQNDFSHDELAKAFGTTVIPGGTIRTFRFHTDLWCGRVLPQVVIADIKFIEASGRKNSISVSTPFESVVVIRTGL